MSDAKEHASFIKLVEKQGNVYGKNPEQAKKQLDRLLSLILATYWASTALLFAAVIAPMVIIFNGGSVATFFLVISLSALWIHLAPWFTKHPHVDYIEVFRDDCPELFSRCDAIADKIGVKRVKVIYLNHERNAGAGSHSDWFWKKPEPYLLFGGPLLVSESADDVDGVIAHELAHHSSGDGDFYYRLYKAITLTAWLSTVLPFLKNMVREANALYLTYSKTIERKADLAILQATAYEHLATHLIRSYLHQWMVEPTINLSFSQWVLESEKPIPNYYQRVSQILRKDLTPHPEILKALLQRKTGHIDSHPALSERLELIGIQLSQMSDEAIQEWAEKVSRPLDESGITVHLGLGSSALEKLDADWQKQMEGRWRSQRNASLQSQKILERLPADPDLLTVSECDEVAMALSVLKGDQPTLDFLIEARKRFPKDTELLKRLAWRQFEANPLQVAWLIDEMLTMPSLKVHARYLQCTFDWYFSNGAVYSSRSIEYAEAVAEEQKLRDKVTGFNHTSQLSKHKLKQYEIDSLVESAEDISEVKQAFVFSRQHPEIGWIWADIVVFVIKVRSFQMSSERVEDQLAKKIRETSGISDSNELYVFATTNLLSKWLKNKHSDKMIYSKPK